jgi:hypothetical protein
MPTEILPQEEKMLISLTLHFKVLLALAFRRRMYSSNLQWNILTFASGVNLMATTAVLLQRGLGQQILRASCLASSLIIRNSFAIYLLRHEMEVASQLGKADDLCRSTMAMQSAIRTIVCVLKEGMAGMPMDLDTLSFWSHHMIYLIGLMHIKFSIRDENYISDLEAMTDYLRYFAPRYKLYST